MAQAKIGDIVKVHFICKLEDGTLFDSSIEKEPLTFTIGEGQVMQGLEQAVIGMVQGESKTVKIPADKAFGPYLAEKVHVIGREQFPENLQPVVGIKFEIKQEDGTTNVVRVTDVSESSVTLDTNHPLAGKDLSFDIELIDVEQTNISKAAELYDQGIAFQDKGQLDEAIKCYQKAIELNPNLTGAFYNLGVAFQKKGDIDRAILYYEIAIGLNPDMLEAHHNLGIVFKDKGRFDDAIMCFQRVIQLKPDHAGAYYNFGNTLVAKGQFNEALQSYQKAIEIDPDFADAHWSIALLNLRYGNFEKGWKGYEWRWKLKDIMVERDFSQPLWDGSDVNINGKTILLHAEQGLGDTIQFIRYAPLVAGKDANVIIECQKELVSLLHSVDGVQQIIARDGPLPEFDFHCPLLSLPFVFKTTLFTIPDKVPYIQADSNLMEHWRNKLSNDDTQVKIGLVWAGDPRLKYGQDRSCPLEKFAPLAQFDNITFYSLQKGGPSRQVFTPPKGMRIIDYSIEMNDFSETAALIENLDLTISVDTAVAHLAGALGKPIWTLLPFVPDWRWMLNREDSPWYPTMKLFRQPSRGDWESVIDRIKDALKDFIHNNAK